MKHVSLSLISLAFSSILYAGPIVVNAPVDHLFVPNGFDNNDNVEVVVTGNFPNTCYSRNKVDVVVKDENINVTVTSLVNGHEQKDVCDDKIEIPFMENVTIGNLQAGNYKINVNNKLQENLNVEIASSRSVDSHLYALINYIELGFTGGLSGDAVLVGRIQESCLNLDSVEYLSNGKDTLSILPIMKKVSDECTGERKYLEVPVKFKPRAFSSDKVLLFVRTMDGKSVSSLVDKNL